MIVIYIYTEHVTRYDTYPHHIDATSWMYVRRLCPRLQVHASLEGIAAYYDVIRILRISMPLTNLSFRTGQIKLSLLNNSFFKVNFYIQFDRVLFSVKTQRK